MRKSVQVILIGFCLISLIPACALVTPAPTPTTILSPTHAVQVTPTQSLDAQQYLTAAMDIIEQNAINSKDLDWTEVRAAALLREKNAKTPQDTYDTIADILNQLQDHHSFF